MTDLNEITFSADIAAVFAEHGNLAKSISGYEPRTVQIELATAVAQAIASNQHLIAEAGTGTGKTFAYLVPAILSAKKTIVSTGTKNLQDQLFQQDIPLIRKALKRSFKAVLLKGRSNYLCYYRLENALENPFNVSPFEYNLLKKIQTWSRRTRSGDIADMSTLAENNPVWTQATSTRDNCLGSECPNYDDCFLVKARRQAQEADLIVVNHHLLCADWSIRETGFGELLPNAEVIVLDEAHQLADTASNFLGLSFSSTQMLALANDSLNEYFKEKQDMPDLRDICEQLPQQIKQTRLAFGKDTKKGDWRDISNDSQLCAALAELQNQLQTLTAHLLLASVRSKGLENCYQRAEEMRGRLHLILESTRTDYIRWYETYKNSFSLSSTPIDIAADFNGFMQQHPATWIFTSATLSVGQRFDHFARTLGLLNVQSYRWESPFNYFTQALFYHPTGLPQPSDADFTDKILEFALPVLKASRGRAFFLFTSYRALERAAQLLEPLLDYPLLVQGSAPKASLLEQFKQYGNAVLLGTASFWEGVDVKGEALSCVIIDKLPFASPADPVLKARLEALAQQGRNGFMEYQVPEAAIALKQGVGRLIRDVHDKGVLMVCDPRLLKRGYGQIFLDSIPPMRRTRELGDVQAFFENL